MAITAASLLVKVGYDAGEVDSGLDRTQGKLSTASVAIGSMVGNLAANVISQLPGAVYSAATSMEDAMVPIGTLVGAGTEQFKELEAGIKDMVASSPDSPEELGSAAYMILSSGITDNATALKALADATDLAGAGLGSTEDATNLITSAMNSFKGENLDSEKAAKLFFGTIASGKTTTAELAQGFGGIAPLASAAGVSFNDLMAATAAITSTGAPASQAYSGLKGAISAIIKPTKDASDTAEELGINFSQAHLASVGLPAFLEEVKTATGGNIETMAKLFGGVEGLNTVLALTGPQADAFAANLENVGVAGEGMAARAAETDQTVSARFATMKNKVMVVLGDLGQKGFVVLFQVIERLSPIVTSVVTEVVGGFRALRAAFIYNDGDITSDGFAGVMERIGYAAAQVVDWFKANWPQIRATVEEVLQGLVTVAQAVWPHLSTIIDTVVANIRDNIIPSAILAFQWISTTAQEVVAIIQEHWPKISEIISQVGAIIVDVINLVSTIIKTQTDITSQIWTRWGDQIWAVVSVIFGLIFSTIGNVLNLISGVIRTVTAVIKGDWQGAWEGIKQIFGAIWDQMGLLVGTALELLKGRVWGAWEAIKGYVQDGLNWIVNQITSIPGRITSAASGMWDGIVDGFRGAINWIIRSWNGLEFSMPSIDTKIPGVGTVGGFSVGTPNIPELAAGGIIGSSGTVLVGERGPEYLNLPRGASVVPLGAAGASYNSSVINVYMPPGSNGDDVVRALKDYERRNGAVPVKVR